MFLLCSAALCVLLKEKTGGMRSLTGFLLYFLLSSLAMRRGDFFGLSYLLVLLPFVCPFTRPDVGYPLFSFFASLGVVSLGLMCVSVG